MKRIIAFLAFAALLGFTAAPTLAQSDGSVRALSDSAGAGLAGVAKTATFNSETLNLQGYATVCLVFDIGTVSGTSPTLDIKMQMSLDGGSVWLDTFPDALNSQTQAALAQITATTETAECWRNPFPTVAGFASGTGINPRARAVFTIGGSSPSFTFTNAYVVTSESP